jgi:hypothetical protein
MKHVLVGVLMAASITVAFAGKEERDFMEKEVQPAARGAEAKWKASCGCALHVAVDENSFTVKHDMYAAKAFCDRVAESITGYCTDGASKKAMCQMKTMVVKRGNNAAFSYKGGTGVAIIEQDASPSWDMVTRELDK